MPPRCLLPWLLAVLVVSQTACHTFRFEVADGPHERVVHHRKSFWMGGLFPEQQVDLVLYCPNGVAAIEEETRFVDGLLAVLTFSIWTPRSSWYYCLPDPGGP